MSKSAQRLRKKSQSKIHQTEADVVQYRGFGAGYDSDKEPLELVKKENPAENIIKDM